MEAALDLSIARSDWPDPWSANYDRIWPAITTTLEGALRELVMTDVVTIRYFGERIDWFEREYWWCGLTEQGQRIIY